MIESILSDVIWSERGIVGSVVGGLRARCQQSGDGQMGELRTAHLVGVG